VCDVVSSAWLAELRHKARHTVSFLLPLCPWKEMLFLRSETQYFGAAKSAENWANNSGIYSNLENLESELSFFMLSLVDRFAAPSVKD
jgi:hypothetical protein